MPLARHSGYVAFRGGMEGYLFAVCLILCCKHRAPCMAPRLRFTVRIYANGSR